MNLPKNSCDEISTNGFLVLRDVFTNEKILDVHKSLERLFALPMSEKVSYLSQAVDDPGYVPYGIEKALDTGIPNLLEAWELSCAAPINWPKGLISEWKMLVEMEFVLFAAATCAVGSIETELGLDSGDLSKFTCFEASAGRFLNYPKEMVAGNNGARRQSIHSDMSLITLLPAATAPGLIIHHLGKKIKGDIERGDVIVLPGQVLEFLTAGTIKACLHTVEMPENADSSYSRISMPFFVMPNDSDLLKVSKKLSTEPNNARCQPIKMEIFKKGYYDAVFSKNEPV